MNFFIVLTLFLVAAILPVAIYGEQQQALKTVQIDRTTLLKQATRNFLTNNFEAEVDSVEESNLRSQDLTLQGTPIQGYFQSTSYSTVTCDEDTDRTSTGIRLNTCINVISNPEDKEKAFLLYVRLVDNQVVGYYQSYADAGCTKKRGKPRKWITPVGVCLQDGTRYEINAGLENGNHNYGVANAIFKNEKGCNANKRDGILVYYSFPFNRCQHQQSLLDYTYTSCSGDTEGGGLFDSSDGTCTGDEYPWTMTRPSCYADSGGWVQDICV
jgi:hypothetical protein